MQRVRARFSRLCARAAVLSFPAAVGRRFYADRCLLRAAALAYASIFSIVPLFAVMFAVLKGLGVQRRLEPLLLSRLSLSPETTTAIIGYIDHTNVSTLGTLGAALLLVTVVSTLSGIEESFNHIWRVGRGRTVWRRVSDYLSVVLLTPFLLLAAVAMTSVLHLHQLLAWVEQNVPAGSVLVQGWRYIPIAVNAVALAVLYAVMPNRRPSPVAIAVGAVVAGVAWQAVQWTYVSLQIGVAHYNAIYGALSQLPVTLAWLYVSWAVVLGGAEVAAVYELGAEAGAAALPVNPAAVALEVLVRAARAFAGIGGAVDPLAVARALRVEPSTVADITAALAERGWLVPVDGPHQRYVLARDPGTIGLAALADERGEEGVPTGCAAEVHAVFHAVSAAGRDAWAQWRLADVLNRTPSAAADPSAGPEET
jgi:membrane protein